MKFGLAALAFVVLATLNSGGYRYGASDQAFYQPAVLKQLDPALFPRDTRVLAAQTRLTAADEVLAAVVRIAQVPVPTAFALLYVVSLLVFTAGAWTIGSHLYRHAWTAVALIAALSLRHAIARSGTNTLEGYFHPRLLAYGLGAVAVAAFLKGRTLPAIVAVAVAAAVHPTTALWFVVWLAAATAIAVPAWRRWLALAGAVAAVAGLWALLAGPLAGRLGVMDPEWRAMLASKDYLFPLEWPVYAWLVNLGYLPLILWIHRMRHRAAAVGPRERALVLGLYSLAIVFAVALVLHAIGVTIAIQLQPARVFWMFDFVAVVYAVWAIAEGGSGTPSRARLAAAALLAVAAARGIYVVAEARRPAVQVTIPANDWGHVMAFARTTDTSSGWLADPMHAVKYGTSVRVAGERDVFVEAVKDAALGMYDRDIAVRTDERLRRLPDFDTLTADEARRIGAEYGLDYLVTDQALALPPAFASGPLRVYRLQ